MVQYKALLKFYSLLKSDFSFLHLSKSTGRALHKFDFHQIYAVQIWCKKVQTTVKSRAKIVNTAFTLEFTTPCKLVWRWGIYHLCL